MTIRSGGRPRDNQAHPADHGSYAEPWEPEYRRPTRNGNGNGHGNGYGRRGGGGGSGIGGVLKFLVFALVLATIVLTVLFTILRPRRPWRGDRLGGGQPGSARRAVRR